MLRMGPLVLGFTLLLLSFHPVFVEVLGWAIPIHEQSERPLFASLALVLAGLGLVVYATVWPQRVREAAPPADEEKPRTM